MLKKINWALFGILIYYLVVCFYRLDTIPGEWFGDISIINNYVTEIISHHWPSYFSTSQGPLYYYLIAPFIYLFGATYLNYKICSVVTGLIGIIFIYLFVKTLTNKSTGLIAAFLTASSFWYLVWCRLGYNIIGPIISTLSLFLFVNYQKTKKSKYLYSGIFISSLGLINYAGTFFLPAALVIIFLLDVIFKSKANFLFILKTLIVFIISLIPVIIILSQNPQNLTSGYLGEKIIQTKQNTASENINRLTTNLRRTLGMFHFEGDIVFRWNVSKSPHLDILSGTFLIIGLIFSFVKKRFTALLLMVATLILILPSIYPGHPLVEVPSSPRTQVIIPIVIYFISFGIYSVTVFIKKFSTSGSKLFLISVLVSISFFNLKKYFVDYPTGLPNHNTPFGKIIAQDIDKLSPTTFVYLADIGWGDWGQPETDGIYFALKRRIGRENIRHGIINNCAEININNDNYIIFGSSDNAKINLFQQCFPQAQFTPHFANSQLIYNSLFIKTNRHE